MRRVSRRSRSGSARLDLVLGGPGQRHLDRTGPVRSGRREVQTAVVAPPRWACGGGCEGFISSVITGMEGYRAAVRQAAEMLGHTVTAAEDFRASPHSPRQVCPEPVRAADVVVVLLLGARYGALQGSGISPAHEEYREARGTKPVLAFVQKGITCEPERERFVEEVSSWEASGYRESFDTPGSLRAAAIRALHDWELSQRAGPVNEDELMARTAGLLPTLSAHATGVAPLHVVVAGAPAQQLLLPSALDDAGLRRDMQREAVYGDTRRSIRSRVCRNRSSKEQHP